MNPKDFLKTVYFGDRFCKELQIDNVNNEFRLKIDAISRIRSADGLWHYYFDEDIKDGYVVLTNVRKFFFVTGLIPNDEIYDIDANEITNNIYEFCIKACNIDENGDSTDIEVKIIAENVYLFDPKKPDEKITN